MVKLQVKNEKFLWILCVKMSMLCILLAFVIVVPFFTANQNVLAQGPTPQATATIPPTPTSLPVTTSNPEMQETQIPVTNAEEENKSQNTELMPTSENVQPSQGTQSKQSIVNSNVKTLDKMEASRFFSEGQNVTITNVGENFFDVQIDSGEKLHIVSIIKPKLIEYYIDEFGLSDVRQVNGFIEGQKGNLKSAKTPEDTMGVGKNAIDVTPQASDGIPAENVIPLFTLSTPKVIGPNDHFITDEFDYDPSVNTLSKNEKHWFEIFKGLMNGTIWTIFEQSNRYFTMVDRREWNRFTPGHIFGILRSFEYIIPIPDRILSIRKPKYIPEEEKYKSRFVLHDYSVQGNTIRILIPTYEEITKSPRLEKINNPSQDIGYKEINTVLMEDELGDGEKFTWNNPIKVILSITGNEYTIYLPTQGIIDINGNLYQLPSKLIGN